MKKLIIGLVLIFVFTTSVHAQDITLATEDTDVEFSAIKDPNIEFCSPAITRFNRIVVVEEESEVEYYYLSVANFYLPSGMDSCFWEYEIRGNHLYGLRPAHDSVCQVEYSRIYCWDILYPNEGEANMRVYGKQPDEAWDFAPTTFTDNYSTWVFYYFPSFLGIVTK